MNTKPSKITLKKQDLPLRNCSTQSYDRISRELSLSRLLYLDFPKNSREILMEFFRNAEINLQPVYRPPPLKKNRRGGGSVHRLSIKSSASKGYCVSDVTGK